MSEKKELNIIQTSVQQCQRCGRNHDEMTFEALLNPVDEWTHFAICPTTNQPIHLRVLGAKTA